MSSRLLIVESLRACSRYGSEFEARAREGLADLALLPMDDALLYAAARLMALRLRSSDAIHLATAISLGDRLGVMLYYDERLADAATSIGLATAQPGRRDSQPHPADAASPRHASACP